MCERRLLELADVTEGSRRQGLFGAKWAQHSALDTELVIASKDTWWILQASHKATPIFPSPSLSDRQVTAGSRQPDFSAVPVTSRNGLMTSEASEVVFVFQL